VELNVQRKKSGIALGTLKDGTHALQGWFSLGVFRNVGRKGAAVINPKRPRGSMPGQAVEEREVVPRGDYGRDRDLGGNTWVIGEGKPYPRLKKFISTFWITKSGSHCKGQ